MSDIRQNKKYAKFLQRQNWLTVETKCVFYYIKKILFFSLIKVQRPKKIRYDEINSLIKQYKALQVIIEPRTKKEAKKLINNGWRQTTPFIPSKTLIINLNKPIRKIFASFRKKTRYSIRKSEKINVHEEKNLAQFRKYWKDSVGFQRPVLSLKQLKDLKEVFGVDCLFLIAKNGIAGGVFLVAERIGYYWYGFANKNGRRKLAQYQVIWQGIKWAKIRGAKHFDMEGIYDERFPLSGWIGFSKFKTGFGGKMVEYPGAFQKTTLKIW